MSRQPLQGVLLLIVSASLLLTACGAPAAPAPTATPVVTATIGTMATSEAAPQADLSGIKAYLLDKGSQLKAGTLDVKAAGDAYYELAKASDFDYAALWAGHAGEVKQTIEDARAGWMAASPLYEQMEGIVAGTPSLADYDVILDAGASGAEDPEGAVPFDLTLPDGRVLPRPGNLFGVTESALWGTFEAYRAPVEADWDGDGAVEFGETLPDAGVLKAAADALDSYTAEMVEAASTWQPTELDAFTALVVMVPTMSEYFNSWKNSRFILGDASTQRDFVVISRLSDIQNILGSLEVVYAGVKPMAETADSAQAAQIEQGLVDLKSFVSDVYTKEQNGQKFTPEEADFLGAEAQNRATAIAGQVAQLAAKLEIKIEE